MEKNSGEEKDSRQDCEPNEYGENCCSDWPFKSVLDTTNNLAKSPNAEKI